VPAWSGSSALEAVGAFRDFEDFWLFYLGEHRHPANRALHALGTAGLLPAAVLGLCLHPAWFAAGPAFAYALAWTGHLAVERNRPATWRHPWWSLRGDVRMLRRMFDGRLRRDLAALPGAGPDPP